MSEVFVAKPARFFNYHVVAAQTRVFCNYKKFFWKRVEGN